MLLIYLQELKLYNFNFKLKSNSTLVVLNKKLSKNNSFLFKLVDILWL